MYEKTMEKLGTIFYIGLFPFIFFVIFGGMVLFFLDIPVWQNIQRWGNKLPVINHVIPGSNHVQAENSESTDYWKHQYASIAAELKEKDQKMNELNRLLDSQKKTIKDVKMNNEELQKQLENKQNEDFHKQLQQVADIYGNMTASKAAAIFQTMPLEEASQIILFLEQEQQSFILGKMKDAKKAGQITMIIKEISIVTEYDEISLKKQIHELAQELE